MGFSQKGNILPYSSPAVNTHTPGKVDDDDEPSGVEMYTPSPRQAQSGQGWFFFQSRKLFDKENLWNLIVHQQSDDSDEDEDESGDETGDEDMEALMPKYDPKEFENLDVK